MPINHLLHVRIRPLIRHPRRLTPIPTPQRLKLPVPLLPRRSLPQVQRTSALRRQTHQRLRARFADGFVDA